MIKTRLLDRVYKIVNSLINREKYFFDSQKDFLYEFFNGPLCPFFCVNLLKIKSIAIILF